MALPDGSNINRTVYGSSVITLPRPRCTYHSAFLRAQVHKVSPSGASKKQLWYNGFTRVLIFRIEVLLSELLTPINFYISLQIYLNIVQRTYILLDDDLH